MYLLMVRPVGREWKVPEGWYEARGLGVGGQLAWLDGEGAPVSPVRHLQRLWFGRVFRAE